MLELKPLSIPFSFSWFAYRHGHGRLRPCRRKVGQFATICRKGLAFCYASGFSSLKIINPFGQQLNDPTHKTSVNLNVVAINFFS